jgi:hypothetical protein
VEVLKQRIEALEQRIKSVSHWLKKMNKKVGDIRKDATLCRSDKAALIEELRFRIHHKKQKHVALNTKFAALTTDLAGGRMEAPFRQGLENKLDLIKGIELLMELSEGGRGSGNACDCIREQTANTLQETRFENYRFKIQTVNLPSILCRRDSWTPRQHGCTPPRQRDRCGRRRYPHTCRLLPRDQGRP